MKYNYLLPSSYVLCVFVSSLWIPNHVLDTIARDLLQLVRHDWRGWRTRGHAGTVPERLETMSDAVSR